MYKKLCLFMMFGWVVSCGKSQAVVGAYNMTAALSSGTCASANPCPMPSGNFLYVVTEVNGVYTLTDDTGTQTTVSLSGDTLTYSGAGSTSTQAGCTTTMSKTITFTPNGTTAKGSITDTLTPPCDGSSNASCQCVFNLTGTFTAP